MALSTVLLCVLLAFALGASSTTSLPASRAPTAQRPAFDWSETKNLLVFGDSYSFVQGTAGLLNYSFIGDAFNLSFTPDQLLTNEIVPNYTSSDGSNWVEFLTGCYSGLPANCQPYALWDFAFAGADISRAILSPHHNFSIALVDEVQQWATYAVDVLRLEASKTLVAWWIGINDTGDTVAFTNITDWTAYWETEFDAMFGAIDVVYSHGFRNHLFINVPPEERSPAYVNGNNYAETLRQHINLYNHVFAERVDRFALERGDTNIFQFDAHSWWNDILDNYEEYGFKNITGYCTCSDDTYFWYNTGHPTQRVHELLAARLKAKLGEWSR